MSTPVTPAVIELVPTDPPQLAITRDGMTTTVTLDTEDIREIAWLTSTWCQSIEAENNQQTNIEGEQTP